MATINKTFKTKKTADEMKNYISSTILPRPELNSLLDNANWEGNVLKIESKIGNGTFTLTDNQIDIVIELNFFGSVAQKAIEANLDTHFKSLGE